MLFANMAVARKIHKAFPDVTLLRRHPPPKERAADFLVGWKPWKLHCTYVAKHPPKIHESNYAIHDMQPLPFCKHPLGVTGNDIYRSLGVINIVCAEVECGWPILHRLALALLHICIFLSHKLWLRTCSPHSYREDVLFLSLGCHMQQSGYPVRYKLSIGNTGIIIVYGSNNCSSHTCPPAIPKSVPWANRWWRDHTNGENDLSGSVFKDHGGMHAQ